MPFLTIAGITVSVTEIRERDPIVVGDEGRSYDGSLRGDITGEKRVWEGTGLEASQADYEALRAAVALGAHVAVAGDGIPGAPRTMRVRLNGGSYVRDNASFLIVPSFTMEDA